MNNNNQTIIINNNDNGGGGDEQASSSTMPTTMMNTTTTTATTTTTITLPPLQQQQLQITERNEQQTKDLLLHFLLIESVLCYYVDFSLFLFVIRLFFIYGIYHLKKVKLSVLKNRWVFFVAVLLGNIPNLMTHLILYNANSAQSYSYHRGITTNGGASSSRSRSNILNDNNNNNNNNRRRVTATTSSPSSAVFSYDPFILHFFKLDEYHYGLALFIDCIVVLFQCMLIHIRRKQILRERRTSHSPRQQTPDDQVPLLA